MLVLDAVTLAQCARHVGLYKGDAAVSCSVSQGVDIAIILIVIHISSVSRDHLSFQAMATLSSADNVHNGPTLQYPLPGGDCVQTSGKPSGEYHNDQIDHKSNGSGAMPPSYPISEPFQETTIYDGFRFFKADPIPGQEATWTRVERTQMHLSQSELYQMVQKRASKISAAKQYLTLSDSRRTHVNQLIHEQRRYEPQFEWSCVYAKERASHRGDQSVTSMDVILMRRPMRTRSNPRTPMGDLVDLGVPFHPGEINGYRTTQGNLGVQVQSLSGTPGVCTLPTNSLGRRSWESATDQNGNPECVAQGPLPRPMSLTLPFTGLELGQGNIAVALGHNQSTHQEE